MPLNRKRIDLDPDFDLEAVRSRLVWPHQCAREFGIPLALQNQLDEVGILPVYKIGSHSVLYRADVERLVSSLPLRQGEAVDAAATVQAELESVLRLIQLVRRARRPAQAGAEAA
jgi:hypothetical protein